MSKIKNMHKENSVRSNEISAVNFILKFRNQNEALRFIEVP